MYLPFLEEGDIFLMLTHPRGITKQLLYFVKLLRTKDVTMHCTNQTKGVWIL